MGHGGGLTFPLLSDASGDVSKAYGADLSIPLLGKFSDRQTFLVDKDQVVRGHWLERDGSMASVKAPLGPGSHAQQILDRLDALSRGGRANAVRAVADAPSPSFKLYFASSSFVARELGRTQCGPRQMPHLLLLSCTSLLLLL